MRISAAHIQASLRAINPGWRLRAARPLGGRAYKLLIGVEAGGAASLILLSHSGADRRRNPQIARDEFRLLGQLRQAGLPVARPLRLDERHDPPFLITECIAGSQRFAPDDVSSFCGRLAEILSSIHALDPSRQDMNFLPRQAALIGERLASGQGAEDRILMAMRGQWPKLRRNPPRLLHGDYWPGNLLWRGERLTGIIDWEDAMIGDPLGDLGKSRLEIFWALGAAAMEHYTADYLALSRELDANALPFWDLWGALRLSHYASFATDSERVPEMRAQYEAFVMAALHGLDRL